jgi:hypothetical protein
MKKWAYTKHDKLADEDLLTGPQLFRDRHLTDHFTDRVMEQISKTEILPASSTKFTDASGMRRSRRMRRTLLWGSTVLVAGAIAASLFLFNPSVVPQSSLSSTPQRLLILPNEWTDLHLADAKKLGIIQQPNIEVSDQGYTLTLQEVVADPNRMVLNVRITDKAGKPVNEAMSMFDAHQLQLQNGDGETIGKVTSVVGWESKTAEGKFNQEYLLLTYTFPDEDPGDTVFIKGDIHELVTNHKKGKTVSGNWNFSYKADMTKANKLSVTTELKEAYTTPDGLNIEMKRLVHTPAGVKLVFTTSFTDEATTNTSKDLRKKLGVMYHIVAENGDDLTRVNSPKNGGYHDNTMDYTVKEIDTVGTMEWTYYFKNLPYDSQQITFVLDGYYVPVESNDSITFQPQELQQNPAAFKAQGDTLNVNAMTITETTDEPGISGWMSISGEFTNHYDNDEWLAHDTEGKEYKVIRRGAHTIGENVTFGETKEHANLIYLIVKDLQTLPEELTLTRTITDKKYTNVDWSFELPRIERNKDLKNQ